jgi:glucose/arabinose dehydrogenase
VRAIVRSPSMPPALAAVASLLALATGCGDGSSDGNASTKPGTQGATEESGGPTEGARGAAPAAVTDVRLVRVGTFDSPLFVTAPPGDRSRVFVVEKTGRVRLLLNGKLARRSFLDLSGEVSTGGEQGLLSIAFAPDYSRSGRFYVYFTDRRGDTRVQEFRRSAGSPNRADRSSRRPVLSVDQPFENHNGGLVLFGPDGYLYIGLGDGGSAGDPGNRAQRLSTLLGKLLRIDPRRHGAARYRSPPTNPFARGGGQSEIYAYGLRNPWRFSFDRKTGDLYIGDVGQNSYEEIDYARRGGGKGRNYGWSCFEGNARYDSSRSCPRPTRPVHQYDRSNGECSVTGGVVVRDPQLGALGGRYLYGDYCRGQVRSFRIQRGRATQDRSIGLEVPSLSSFGEDAAGRVYLTSLEGPVYRLAPR